MINSLDRLRTFPCKMPDVMSYLIRTVSKTTNLSFPLASCLCISSSIQWRRYQMMLYILQMARRVLCLLQICHNVFIQFSQAIWISLSPSAPSPCRIIHPLTRLGPGSVVLSADRHCVRGYQLDWRQQYTDIQISSIQYLYLGLIAEVALPPPLVHGVESVIIKSDNEGN